ARPIPCPQLRSGREDGRLQHEALQRTAADAHSSFRVAWTKVRPFQVVGERLSNAMTTTSGLCLSVTITDTLTPGPHTGSAHGPAAGYPARLAGLAPVSATPFWHHRYAAGWSESVSSLSSVRFRVPAGRHLDDPAGED